MNDTFDNKRLIAPYGIIDIDQAFLNWFDKKLNLHTTNKSGDKIKIPVRFVSPERWSLAREVGIRDENGTLILPIITVSRIEESSDLSDPYERTFKDIKGEHVYHKQIDKKSSLIKELNKTRPKTFNPSLPVYEVYTFPTPDYYHITYEVMIWTEYISEMNEVIEKIGQNMDYKSVKSFNITTEKGMNFTAFQDPELSNESNSDDFTGDERIIRREFTFHVTAHILPESNERIKTFKRYFSQTKLVIKEEIVESIEED